MKTLRNRITVLFMGALLLMQLVSFGVIHSSINTNVARAVQEQVLTGARVLDRLVAQNTDGLDRITLAIAGDFGFRAAVASGDLPTIRSALANHGGRSEASVIGYVSRDDTLEAMVDQDGRDLPFPMALRARSGVGMPVDVAASLLVIDGSLVQLAMKPVRAPVLIGHLVVGFRVDARLSADLKLLTGIDSSFLAMSQSASASSASPLTVLAGSAGQNASSLRAALALASASAGLPFEADLGGVTYSSVFKSLGTTDGVEVRALLQRSISEAAAPYDRLQITLLVLTTVGLLLSVVLSFATAHRIAGPIRRLVDDANRLGEGDRNIEVQVDSADEVGQLAVAFQRMSDRVSERESTIRSIAYTDELTGLPNRNCALQDLALTMTNAHYGSLIVINLKRFKFVNDVLGLASGDALLKLVAARLHTSVNQTSVVIARTGGNEFAVLGPQLDAGQAMALARTLLGALEAPFEVAETNVDVRAAVGIAQWPEHGDSSHVILARAETAMVSARQSQSMIFNYDESIDLSSAAGLSMISELRLGIAQRHLQVFYQPKIDLRTQAASSAEALIRWFHPSRGMVPPDAFIPFAESSGLIVELTDFVLREVVSQIARWQASGLHAVVSVNLSARDLLNNQLSDQIMALLNEYGVGAGQLVLEITESAIIEDLQNACKTLDQLRSNGLKISVDDYGTGYSSLAYLKQLPIDELKIDRSFVMSLVNDASDRVIVRSTIDLGHKLGLTVVAEGIEDLETAGILAELGCDTAQGYFFGKPMDAPTVTAWFKSWNAQSHQSLCADGGTSNKASMEQDTG